MYLYMKSGTAPRTILNDLQPHMPTPAPIQELEDSGFGCGNLREQSQFALQLKLIGPLNKGEALAKPKCIADAFQLSS